MAIDVYYPTRETTAGIGPLGANRSDGAVLVQRPGNPSSEDGRKESAPLAIKPNRKARRAMASKCRRP